VVHGALPRTAVVLVAGGERGGVERAHRGVLAGGEREVDVLRERPLVDQQEAIVLAPEVRAAGLVVPQPDPGVRRDGRVEALGRREVGDSDPQVVDAAVSTGRARSPCTASALLPSGSSRNPP
jgi:hypothetical protein